MVASAASRPPHDEDMMLVDFDNYMQSQQSQHEHAGTPLHGQRLRPTSQRAHSHRRDESLRISASDSLILSCSSDDKGNWNGPVDSITQNNVQHGEGDDLGEDSIFSR